MAFIAYSFVALFIINVVSYNALCDFCYNKYEQTCLSYDGEILVTDSEELTFFEDNTAYVNHLSESLRTGDKLIIKTSKVTGEVLEITSNGSVVYMLNNAPWYALIIVYLFIGALVTVICMGFYIINAKNPKGVFAELQSMYVIL